MTWAAIAVVYTIFMLLSGGLKHLVLACILLAPGTLMFILARREQGQRVFRPLELGLLGVFVVGAAAGIYGLVTGMITI
jgi:arginine:ornithine antiporter/lysine permease